MSVQILIGALLTGDVPSGYDHTHNRVIVGDDYRLLTATILHPASTATSATKACRLLLPAHSSTAAQAVSSYASAITHLVRPLLRHILMPPGI